MSGAYYNEFDPFAAQWLRNLIAARLLPAGDVDERDIRHVAADDLKVYKTCHFFAGIGGWPYGLRLAGWPDARSVWTGSPPCQPFSNAGQRQGAADPRHLWPALFRLIAARRPALVMGEQVAAALAWLDGVAADLEGAGYAFRAVIVPACAVDAPHIRDRLWFLADRDAAERRTPAQGRHDDDRADPGRQETPSGYPVYRGDDGYWRGARWLICGDGKARRVKSGIHLLADGISARIPKLRAFGNAVVPQLVAEIAGAYLDTEEKAA